jgi:hypothetical protein
MKVLINAEFGGFGLSQEAIDMFNERSEKKVKYSFELTDKHRSDPILISIVEELGERANDGYSELEIATIPDGYDYAISDYDGLESIHLEVREDHLRKLIQLGNEDDIVNYVMNAN